MFSKGFVLSIGVTLCSTILIYLYVKSRVNSLENKVNSLIQIIQSHGQLSQGEPTMQMEGGSQCNYEKIVVSDDEDEESSDEESSDEEDDVVEVSEPVTEPSQDATIEDDQEQYDDDDDEEEENDGKQILDLTSSHVLHDMEEHVLSPEEDGLDDMDDLDEELDDEEVDYSKMGKVDLRLLCEQKGFETKGKKKHELLQLLGQ